MLRIAANLRRLVCRLVALGGCICAVMPLSFFVGKSPSALGAKNYLAEFYVLREQARPLLQANQACHEAGGGRLAHLAGHDWLDPQGAASLQFSAALNVIRLARVERVWIGYLGDRAAPCDPNRDAAPVAFVLDLSRDTHFSAGPAKVKVTLPASLQAVDPEALHPVLCQFGSVAPDSTHFIRPHPNHASTLATPKNPTHSNDYPARQPPTRTFAFPNRELLVRQLLATTQYYAHYQSHGEFSDEEEDYRANVVDYSFGLCPQSLEQILQTECLLPRIIRDHSGARKSFESKRRRQRRTRWCPAETFFYHAMPVLQIVPIVLPTNKEPQKAK